MLPLLLKRRQRKEIHEDHGTSELILTTHLERECEAHPLVVLVVPGRLGVTFGANALVGVVKSRLTPVVLRDREGRVDPAVGVHDPLGDAFHDAVDRVADVLVEGDQGGAYYQDYEGGLVV